MLLDDGNKITISQGNFLFYLGPVLSSGARGNPKELPLKMIVEFCVIDVYSN